MVFLEPFQVKNLEDKLVSDPSSLGKLYKAKKSDFQHLSVDF
jgi:hypothetical protein